MLAPLYLLTGAPGAGKTTLLPHLIEAADGLVVMEMDELLEQDGSLLGVRIADPEAAPVWPAYDRMWERIVTLVRRAGHPVLLLCPVPDAVDGWQAPVHVAALDCPDEVRLSRLRSRGWARDWVEDAMADAAQARALAPVVFDTDDDLAGLARRVLEWTSVVR
ncbi:AAA family ATPase [Nonomuraea sediminis]|uniref:AAA family ATPase n=1 Tax=Nonomuraea sediminis TaxID=2835864 RepID=UPI001BDDBCBB|nr:AAA family ATPase [Nonomuraea sediminis]